MSRYYWYC